MIYAEAKDFGYDVIRVFDTETTGFPPNAGVVEYGVTSMFVHQETSEVRIGKTVSKLTKPKFPINVEAMAVHHITPEMIALAEPADEALAELAQLPTDYWCAHNAAFDRKFFAPPGKWICTLKAARRIWPTAPKHSNQVLRYHLGLHKHQDYQRCDPPHRAGPDTYMTAFLLARMVRSGHTLESLVENEGPQRLHTVPFGKHKGSSFSSLPLSYLRYLINNTQDTDVLYTAQQVLKERQGRVRMKV